MSLPGNLNATQALQVSTDYRSFPTKVPTYQSYDGDEVMYLPIPPNVHIVKANMPSPDSQINNYENPCQDSALRDMRHIYDTPSMPGTMLSSYMNYAEIHSKPSTVRMVAVGEEVVDQEMSE